MNEFNKTFRKQDQILFNNEYICSIACGSVHTLLLSNKGGWSNVRTRLFFGLRRDVCAGPRQQSHSRHIQRCGSLEIIFFREQTQKGNQISRIAAGSNHSGVVVSGQVYLFGLFGDSTEHFFSQPRQVEFPEEVKQIELGDLLSVFLTESGDVYTLGSDQLGQLGRVQKENKALGKGTADECRWIARWTRYPVETTTWWPTTRA